MIIVQHFDDLFLDNLLQYLKRSILCTVSLHQSRLVQFLITGLSRAQRIKFDITVLVLSYCVSIKLIIIYD